MSTKRIILTTAALALTASLTACGGSKSPAASESSSEASAPASTTTTTTAAAKDLRGPATPPQAGTLATPAVTALEAAQEAEKQEWWKYVTVRSVSDDGTALAVYVAMPATASDASAHADAIATFYGGLKAAAPGLKAVQVLGSDGGSLASKML